jgi:hypothetical protein
MQQTQQMQSLRNQQIHSNPALNSMKSNTQSHQSHGMQVLTSEQQLIQQKNLIDQLERQIAQHQSQTTQSSSSNDIKNIDPLPLPTSSGGGGAATSLPASNPFQHTKSTSGSSNNPNQGRHQIPQLQGDPRSSTQMQLQNQLQMNAMVQNNVFKSLNVKNNGNLAPGQSQPNQIGSMHHQRPGSTGVDAIPNQNQNYSMNGLSMNGMNSQHQALNNLQSMSNSNHGANNMSSVNTNVNQSTTVGTQERESSSGSGSGLGNDEQGNLFENLSPTALPIKSTSAESRRSSGNDDTNPQQVSSITWDWQTNSDTPERKRVLFGIMKVIETVQDDGKQNPEK